MTATPLKAEKRTLKGRKVKTLRKEGVLPANVYGKKIKSEEVQVDAKEFRKVFEQAGETGIVELTLGSAKKPVLIHEVQLDSLTDDPIHVDFMQVDLKEKVTATVPVEVEGESPAEKSGIGTVVKLLNEIEVEALPTDLPERFVVDATKLEEVDQVVKVSDLDYDKAKVEVKVDPEELVVKVEPPQKEEVVEAPAPVEAETTEGAEESTEAKPEGEEAPAEETKEE